MLEKSTASNRITVSAKLRPVIQNMRLMHSPEKECFDIISSGLMIKSLGS